MRAVASSRAARLALVLLVAAAVLLPALGARDVWAPDEPRHAEVAREVLRDGHWWYPHVNSRPYADKPPLYFWLAAVAGMARGGVDELAARVPAASAALLSVLLVALLGSRLFGAAAGGLAALALTTTWLFAWMGRRVSLDVLLSLLVLGSIAAAWRGLAACGGADRPARGRVAAWLALAGAVAGLSILTKGPVGLLFIVPALVPLGRQAWRADGRASLAGACAFIAALALVLAAWLVPAQALGGYDPLAVTREHVVERAAEGRDHAQPFFYYLTTLPLDLLPWSLFALPALASAWRARRSPEVAALLSWVLVPVVVLSLIVEKRNLYVLPLVPAWTLLFARWAVTPEAQGAWLRRAHALALGLLVALAALLVAAPALAPRLLRGDALRRFEALALPPVTLIGTGIAIAGAALACARVARRWPQARLPALAGAFAAALLLLFLLLPRFDSEKSGRAMGAVIARETAGAPLGMYPRTWDAYVFYSGRSLQDLETVDELREFLRSSSRPAYVLLYRKHASVLTDLGAGAVEVASDEVGHREVVLFRIGDR